MLNDIKSTLFNLTRNVTKHSGDLVKTTKLTVNLAQEQESLRNLYTEIGKKVHEIYQYGGSLGKFFDEKYREIEGAERKIDALREEIAKVKGVKECPKCGKQVDKLAEFCPKCGMKLDGVVTVGEGGSAPNPVNIAAGYGEYGVPSMVAPSVEAAPPGASAAYAEAAYPETEAHPEISDPSGTAMPPPAFPEIPEPLAAVPEAAPVPAKIKCRVCGTENEPGTKFCLSCGRYL